MPRRYGELTLDALRYAAVESLDRAYNERVDRATRLLVLPAMARTVRELMQVDVNSVFGNNSLLLEGSSDGNFVAEFDERLSRVMGYWRYGVGFTPSSKLTTLLPDESPVHCSGEE